MTTKQWIKILQDFGLDYYNQCNTFICVKGINGQVTILHSNHPDNKIYAVSTLLTLKDHIKQMGRDSLKMELHSLLDITRHV
jgi:hypothetical protein